MTRLILTSLLALRLSAQAGLYIDLSGEWRYSSDNAPEMAQTDYDDSRWTTVTLPPPDRTALRGAGWLRKSVDLPDWADRSQLALTLGPLRSVYAVYVNGVEIARVGSFETRSDSQIARTRTFPIPLDAASRSRKLQLAIRYDRPQGGGQILRLDQNAHYLVTYLAQAPANAGADNLRIQQARFMPALIISAIYLIFCIPLLLAWLSERRRVELAWLVLFLVISAFYASYMVFIIAPGATPFNHYGVPSVGVVSLTATWVSFASFVVAAAGFRSIWPYAALWCAWLVAAIILAGPGGLVVFVGVGTLSGAVAFAAIAVAWWKLRKENAPFSRHVLLAVLLVPAADRLRLNLGRGPESFLEFGDFSIAVQDLFTLVLTSVILILLLRQVVMERRDRQRLQGEMEAARNAQLFLLGSGVAVHSPPFRLDPVYEPAYEVGGDFHWTRVDADGSLSAVVGDVSGKGLKAAMLVSVAIGILRNEKSTSPAEILSAINDGLVGHTDGGFVTCCCARFQLDGSAVLASAGHLSPFCDGRELDLDPGLPLGIVAGTTYVESTHRGDCFTFVSDGVVEAADAQGELFGFERTREISARPASEIAAAAKAWGQNDDITVVTVRRQV